MIEECDPRSAPRLGFRWRLGHKAYRCPSGEEVLRAVGLVEVVKVSI
jgi:hypothetical protein